jgi:CBS domain-containing protein
MTLPSSITILGLGGPVRSARRGGVRTMTATMHDETTLERLLGTVGETMTGEVVLLAADAPAEAALRRLVHRAISGAPVVDRGRVVGVVTQRDLLVPTLLDEPAGAVEARPPRQTRRLAGLRVRDLMSEEPITARPDWSLARAVRAMVDNGVNRMPVVDQHDRPLGVLTRHDVLAAVAGRACPQVGPVGAYPTAPD